jgi:hypothetical protein
MSYVKLCTFYGWSYARDLNEIYQIQYSISLNWNWIEHGHHVFRAYRHILPKLGNLRLTDIVWAGLGQVTPAQQAALGPGDQSGHQGGMDVEGILNQQAGLAGHGRKVVATIQELEMQVGGSVSRTRTVCQIRWNCDYPIPAVGARNRPQWNSEQRRVLPCLNQPQAVERVPTCVLSTKLLQPSAFSSL